MASSASESESIIRDPNSIWGTDAGTTLSDLTPAPSQSRTADTGSSLPIGPGIQGLQAIRTSLIKFWSEHHQTFKSTWKQMTPQTRRNFLKTVSPMLPESRSQPYAMMGNEKVDVSGAANLLPELCLDVLILDEDMGDDVTKREYGKGMIALFDRWCSTEWGLHAHAMDSFDYIRRLLEANQIGTRGPLTPKKFVMMIEGDMFGQAFDFTAKASGSDFGRMMEWREQGVVAFGHEFDLVFDRLSYLLSPVAQFVDEFRQEVLGSSSENKVVRAAIGCQKCGIATKPDNTPLKACNNCKAAFYCSRECQKADWKSHKKVCTSLAQERRANE
ncbi:hypothetical protein HDU76_010034 [Blyttiomyces sp. JEL0837]|nr:hypothetical protein HDU76_010034 [Blyttiomyces sp. JEL0837]